MLFPQLFGLNAKRQRLLKKAPDGPLKDYLSVPFPESSTPVHHLDILSLDFETTGLNAKTDKLLSVGFIQMPELQIKLGTSFHQIITSNGALKADNVAIHQITDQEKAEGKPLAEVVETILKALAGKVMLVHYAKIEREFLKEACLKLYGMAPVIPIIDTLAIEKKRLDAKDIAYDPSQLRLANLRESYHLPGHYAHNALSDAIATAELFLAMIKQRESQHITLKHLLRS